MLRAKHIERGGRPEGKTVLLMLFSCQNSTYTTPSLTTTSISACTGAKRVINLKHNAAVVPQQLQGRLNPAVWHAFMTDVEQVGQLRCSHMTTSATRACWCEMFQACYLQDVLSCWAIARPTD